jgi:flagellar basal-body rod modification protein FlgD
MDSAGQPVADGNYAFKATITSAGQTTNSTVKTLATVRSISQVDAKSPLMLQVDGGLSVAMSDVKRVGN